MSQPEDQLMGGGAAAVTISSMFMMAALIFLFVVVFFIFFLYLYAKYYWGVGPAVRRSRGRLVFATDPAPLPRRGLDAAVLGALPITVYRSAYFKEGIECAVCLSELLDGEEVRLLPKCSHGFHLECIDMWFQSNSTCPLCRSAVGADPYGNPDSAGNSFEPLPREAVAGDEYQSESLVFPTNVMFWGSRDRVGTGRSAVATGAQEAGSSSGKPERMLEIEIPRRMVEGFSSPISPLPSSRLPVEEVRSPASARLRSLRRLLSRGKRIDGSSCSARGGDIEQGLVGGGGATGEGSPLAPKTPANSSAIYSIGARIDGNSSKQL